MITYSDANISIQYIENILYCMGNYIARKNVFFFIYRNYIFSCTLSIFSIPKKYILVQEAGVFKLFNVKDLQIYRKSQNYKGSYIYICIF